MISTSPIKIEVHFTPLTVDEMYLKDKNVVVIDVLRASTTIATALSNGAKEIIPVNNIESALKIAGGLAADVTLRAGERGGRTIQGFNLGNSPLEYTKEIVKGKSIIFMTTNGSAAIVKGRHAKNLVVVSFVNLSHVVSFLKELKEDLTIICAGKENRFCIEDAVCAGRLINKLLTGNASDLLTDDASTAACMLDKNLGKNVLKLLKTSEHGNYLSKIGFADDLEVCADTDSIPVLPVLSENIIKLYNKSGKPNALRKA